MECVVGASPTGVNNSTDVMQRQQETSPLHRHRLTSKRSRQQQATVKMIRPVGGVESRALFCAGNRAPAVLW